MMESNDAEVQPVTVHKTECVTVKEELEDFVGVNVKEEIVENLECLLEDQMSVKQEEIETSFMNFEEGLEFQVAESNSQSILSEKSMKETNKFDVDNVQPLRESFVDTQDSYKMLLELGLVEQQQENQWKEQIDNQDDIDFECEVIEEDEHNSDSEQELVNTVQDPEEMNQNEEKQEIQNMKFYIGRNGDTIWANKPVSRLSKTKFKNSTNLLSGPKGQARNCKTRLECFLQIISLDIIDDIVKYTNIFIEHQNAGRNEFSDTSVCNRDYRPTTRAEMKAVFGALFLIAAKHGNHADFSEFFTKNGTGLIILRANFSEHRFQLLLRSLRFDDIRTRAERSVNDKLAPIREFQSAFVANCQKAYDIGKSATIDEMLVPFRGNCSFVQYMPKKPAKYGLKIYALCDSQTFYTYNMMIYSGLQKSGLYITPNKPFDIVKDLTKPLKNTNRNITTDNWFSSYPLAEYLLSVGLTFIGALKNTMPEVPDIFVTENKTRLPGSHLFGSNDTSTLISFVTKKKKVVLVLSTLHDRNEVDNATAKPIQIMDYNATKNGVDTVDFICSKISTSRRTKRWPMTIFFRCLDIAGINSMVIYQINNSLENINRREYLSSLAIELMDENLRERAKNHLLPTDLRVFLSNYREDEKRRNQNEVIPNKRRFCYICGSRKNNITRLKCNSCNNSICQKHSVHVCNNCHSDVVFDSDKYED